MQMLALLSLLLAVALPLMYKLRACPPAADAARGRMLHLIFVFSVALMAVSSILMLALGRPMRGWMLMLHMSVAPLFAIAVTALALLWAERDSTLLRLVILSAFVTILSAMFNMMTWFGSDWQHFLLDVHRVSSMVLLVAAMAQAGRLLVTGPQHAAHTGH